jgi:hypothetical protein
MVFYEFTSLNEKEQIKCILDKGKLIGQTFENGLNYFVYSINSFLVEITVQSAPDKTDILEIIEITVSRNTDRLDKYQNSAELKRLIDD